VDAFIRQSGAVLAHDATAALGSIQSPTPITFGFGEVLRGVSFTPDR
jgi:hypothetical protein